MKPQKHYMLTLVKPVNPSIDFPIYIERTSLLSYRYHITHAAFYASKLPKWKAVLHLLLFRLMSDASRISVFKNRKVAGKLIMQQFPVQ